MHPYLDTIPDDDREEIKELVRERDERPTKRARRNTSDLLRLAPDGVRHPPKPEDDLDKYDRQRLQQGLRYIDGAVGEATYRRITPRTRAFLKLHKEAYKIALDDDGEDPDKASRAVVQAMDRVYSSASFFFTPRSSEEHDRFGQYLKLRRLDLLVNYGDYLGQESQEIWADPKEAPPRLEPPKTRIDFNEELAGIDATDLRRHVDHACDVLGIDVYHMLWLIAEWAEERNRTFHERGKKRSRTFYEWGEKRNRQFHSRTRMLISECHWTRLAEQLCRDLRELINVAPHQETAVDYEQVILNIQNEYFDIVSRDDPYDWLPSEKAGELTREKVARKERERGWCYHITNEGIH